MNEFGIEEVNFSVNNIIKKLSLSFDNVMLENYQDGFLPNLLSYEKVEKPDIEIPCIQKYLIGAKTYINQPTQFYDIFRSNRHSILIQNLSKAIDNFEKKGIDIDKKIQKLISETDYDPFESVLFELLVANKYLSDSSVKYLSFLEETQAKTPDLEINIDGNINYVECKKYNRINNIFPNIRNEINDLVQSLFDYAFNIGNCLIIEMTFHISPKNIVKDKFLKDCQFAISQQKNYENDNYKIQLVQKQPIRFDEYVLCPSPKFYWERYNYKTKSDWQGLITRMKVKNVNLISKSGKNSIYSSWIDEIDWDCVIKWKIDNQDFLWDQQKLGYNLIFDGLKQLKSKGRNTILHIWIERDLSHGNRKDILLEFFNRIDKNSIDKFSWLIFNETEFDVSINNRFDLIEYAHIIGGPTRTSKEPNISLIFNDSAENLGEFGAGYSYPELQ